MYNQKYWEAKQERKRLAEQRGEGALERGFLFLKRYFSKAEDVESIKGHTRSKSQRRMRRLRHADRIRTAWTLKGVL